MSMKIMLGFIIFFLVLFIYLHIQFHLKTSDDLEIYEIEYPSKEKLEEVCDMRQPLLFYFDNDSIMRNTNISFITNNYRSFEVKIRNVNDYLTTEELYLPLELTKTVKLFNQDKSSSYFSENNQDFLKDTIIYKYFQSSDEFLRPYMVSNIFYDILFGSENTCTPLRYGINYRTFLVLTQGIAQIKMTPPNSSKYLHPMYDYDNFEFRSPINAWKPQTQYLSDFDKIKFLEFTLTPGKTLFIPANWWYTIQFKKDTSISYFSYRTYMNNIAITPYFGLYLLQKQNMKINLAKKINIQELNKIKESVNNTEDEELVITDTPIQLD